MTTQHPAQLFIRLWPEGVGGRAPGRELPAQPGDATRDEVAAHHAAQAFVRGAFHLQEDLALIPGHYLFPKAGAWLMHLFAALDRAWCATPLAPWASGFTAFARRAAEPR